MPSLPPEPSAFLRLPTEVRMMIYERIPIEVKEHKLLKYSLFAQNPYIICPCLLKNLPLESGYQLLISVAQNWMRRGTGSRYTPWQFDVAAEVSENRELEERVLSKATKFRINLCLSSYPHTIDKLHLSKEVECGEFGDDWSALQCYRGSSY
ncbi:hypothetical protein HBI56_057390 [Parastagonospora nodorum]|nr:hypothetical protein HBH53_150370 [Parastagonospora nodorum]KAH3966972.1 hypothetical protein HBH51_141790 [Parastagonospora nodorum]KAH4003161.1 hypothetical protein HBI10_070370 [Parastagonospora nodorum]KAH4790632.1 hypothetical protein HBH62_035270 [Parastagonospora nodorum]KAH4798192.1 hypothetical protein HBH63_075250 [Parastagonospora nodorum]